MNSILNRLSAFFAATANRAMVLILALVVMTLVAYYPLRENDFVNFDDPAYVYNNRTVKKGLTAQNVAWAFKTTTLTNWHPLTWLSHLTDVQLFGLRPAGHHATSFLLHLVNVILLFGVLYLMTSHVWPSFFVAAVFAVHPLNVESVAWVSERKNVLSTLFLLLTIWAYIRYARQPGRLKYLLVIGMFILGLMTKPMLVTLPVLLLMLDFWPLRRVQRGTLLKLGLEKIPLLVLSIVSSVITIKASASGGAMMTTKELTLSNRFSNALLSYVNYLYDLVWPTGLTAFYPHPGNAISYRQLVIAGLLMIGLTVLSVWQSKASHGWFVGWFWYLVTLLPVIGLIQVGAQARADRYAYVPMIGVLVVAAWSANKWTRRLPYRNYWLSGIAVCILVFLIVATRQQVRYWQNGSALWTHTLKVTEDNYVAHTNLAIIMVALGKYDEAIDHCNSALRIVPRDSLTYETLGEALSKKGKANEGIPHLYKALRLTTDREIAISAQRALGEAMVQIGNTEKAIHHFSQALRLDPQISEVHSSLGTLFYNTKQMDRAIFHCNRVAQLSPTAGNYIKLASLLEEEGKLQQAANVYRKALLLEPNSVDAQKALAALENTGKDNSTQ